VGQYDLSQSSEAPEISPNPGRCNMPVYHRPCWEPTFFARLGWKFSGNGRLEINGFWDSLMNDFVGIFGFHCDS